MVDDLPLDLKEFGDEILNMKIIDYIKVCTEKRVECSLLISALTIVSFNLLCQMGLDSINKK